MKAGGTAAVMAVVLALPPGTAGADPSSKDWDREGFKRDIAWVTAMNVADLASTRYMLTNCSTCGEANPFMRDDFAVKKAVGTAMAVGALYIARRFAGDRYANAVRWVIVGFLAVLSGWNVWLAEKRR